MKGNEAIGEGAILAGCRFFFGYPITPQSEVIHYLSRRLPEVGGVCLQAESEIASINMVYGAAGAGARVLTSSSGPGISLMQEGFSYLAGAELPCVIVNMMRGGPGLGNIAASQSDYFQAVKGGGHGDYRMVVLAPNSVQELLDMVYDAFDLADCYRSPVMVISDGVMGQMMEPVEITKEEKKLLPEKPWAACGMRGRAKKNLINSVYVVPEELEEHNISLDKKFSLMAEKECKWEEYRLEGAEIVLVSFGTASRISRRVVDDARDQGIPAGLIRPVSLWPFPYEIVNKAADRAGCFLTVEMNMGQMVEDVRLAVCGKSPVYHYGRTGGMLPVAGDVLGEVKRLYNGGAVR